ncbi:unnamed protein product [Ceratitis capitata]|uniref:(Mediterranean fruit fly) hypothetical protein n=1 Tax=Ceratitis capitata TaxID=7213 RepID=A0A811U5W8_CERCA|nr:unnamed protein product [Ceratitis capitata]
MAKGATTIVGSSKANTASMWPMQQMAGMPQTLRGSVAMCKTVTNTAHVGVVAINFNEQQRHDVGLRNLAAQHSQAKQAS